MSDTHPIINRSDPAPFAAARSVCRRHARSFYFASFFLPKPKRDAAYAVYAFCRLLDDAVDTADAPADAAERIARFQALLDQVYVGTLKTDATQQSLVLRAFQQTVRRYAIPRHYFADLVEGCRMDLSITHYETWPDLQKYCYHVAGVVGLMMCRIFRLRNPRAQEQAILMGQAMQLTNILRDIAEDRAMGRVYLPQEDLRRFGLTDADLTRADPRVRHLMQFQIDRARSLYRQAAQGLCHLPADGSRLTACVMSVLYAGILRVIEKQNYDVFTTRAHLTMLQKLRRLPAAWKLSSRRADHPLPDVF